MLSLAGIPLTAGFIGKFFIFNTVLAQHHKGLAIVAVINAIISIFYYFRVIIAMYFRTAERAQVTVPNYYLFVLGFAALATVLIGVYPEFISSLI